jgi:hypothetical protein
MGAKRRRMVVYTTLSALVETACGDFRGAMDGCAIVNNFVTGGDDERFCERWQAAAVCAKTADNP